MADNPQTIYEINKKISDLKKQDLELERQINEEKKKGDAQDKKKLTSLQKERDERKQDIKDFQELLGIEKDLKNISMEISAVEDETQGYRLASADYAKSIGDSINEQVKSIPLIGGFLSKNLELEEYGDYLKAQQLLKQGKANELTEAQKELQKKINQLQAKMPMFLLVGALALIVAYLKQARDLSSDMSVSFTQAASLAPKINVATAMLIGTGQDAKQISKDLLDTFGTTDKITTGNIVKIGQLSTRFGAASKDIIAVQKNLSDIFGMQVDQTEEVVRNIGKLAQAQGVAAGAVIADMANSSEKFAEFAQDGAMGFAQAAIEARKVGANVSSILGAADKLLGFEESITAQFKAQVLTGKQINLENARRLALEGDFLGLTTEIQSIVGEIGDIQTMNVIERRAIADAIGISVQDLQKISRGEQMEQQMTVQDKLDITNKLLAAGNDLSKEQRDAILEGATRQQNQNLFGV